MLVVTTENSSVVGCDAIPNVSCVPTYRGQCCHHVLICYTMIVEKTSFSEAFVPMYMYIQGVSKRALQI
jgi:hypothetical protein